MPSDSSRWRRPFELAAQAVVLYSIVVFYMESELSEPDAPRAAAGFWLWNERTLVAVFSAEYLYRWYRSPNRLRHPFTLLAAIDLLAIGPAIVGLTVSFRSLKLLRVLPLLWMFKLYRYSGALQNVARGFARVRHELAVVGIVTAIIVVFSAVAMHELERTAQPEKFGRLGDALWWSLVTMTTVGYGDCYPVTAAGRAVAAATMLLGIGALGTFVSLIGSSFLAGMRDDERAPEETPTPGPLWRARPTAREWTGRRAG